MTLFEISIVAIIAGIVAAIGTPSMIGILQGNQVKQGLDQVHSGLQNAQRQAIRRSKMCIITLNPSTDPPTMDVKNPTASDYKGCLGSTEKELPTNSVMKTNFPSNEIIFSFKGNTTSAGTVVIAPKQGSGEKYCLAMGIGLGIMRTGVYTGDINSSISADNCDTSK